MDTIDPVKLSRRLQTVAQRIPQGSRLSDIGSDHALLPVYAVQQGLAISAVAGEVAAGPLDAAKRQIEAAGLSDSIAARLGNGLDVIAPGEVSVITICGMGGCTIQSILDRGAQRLAGVERLILQPNVGEAAVRKWLLRHNWLLMDEQIVEEDERFYEILTATPITNADQQRENEALYEPFERNDCRIDRELLLQMGPYLLRHPTQELEAKWLDEIRKREYIMNQMAMSASEDAARKRAIMLTETERTKEVLQCMRMDRR